LKSCCMLRDHYDNERNRPCFTTQHQTCKTKTTAYKTKTIVYKTKTKTTAYKTKTDFLVADRSCPKTDRRSQTTSLLYTLARSNTKVVSRRLNGACSIMSLIQASRLAWDRARWRNTILNKGCQRAKMTSSLSAGH